ncbi:MAG TPA: gliding motility-associated C-terminal domain-containing protein [Bacteroidales bacterium]|nr:gliding motility-associated C-terminal domain-containing protein [Bacteroidales bacterium]
MKIQKFIISLVGIIILCNPIISQIPTNGLVGFYPFNGNAIDESGNGHNALVSGPVLTTDRCGQADSAYYFDGIDDYMDLMSTFDYPERTVNLWFCADVIDGIERHIYVSDNPYLTNGFSQIKIRELGGLKEIRSSTGVAGPVAEAHAEVKEYEWHMITLTADRDTARHYLDGQFIGKFANSNFTSVRGYESALLGTSRVFDRNYKGKIDDLRIYNRVLTYDEIIALFSLPCNFEITGNQNFCQGEKDVLFSVPYIADLDYEWDYSGTGADLTADKNLLQIDFSENATSGTVSVSVHRAGIRIDQSDLEIHVKELPGDPGIISGPTELCKDDGPYIFSIPEITNALQYEWSFTGNDADLLVNLNSLTLYLYGNASSGSLTVSGINQCGEKTSQAHPLIVKTCDNSSLQINIPNSFSPNGDNVNDVFFIRGLTEGTSVTIFDSNGKTLYSNDNYDNEWTGIDTDGNVLQNGTYWYVIQIPGLNTVLKGFVYIKR